MGRVEIKHPEKTWPLPFKKNEDGNYQIIPPKKWYSGITITNKKNRPHGFLYFIKADGHDLYKIGVSSKPDRRLKDIEGVLPFHIKILSIHFFYNVYDIEANMEKKLAASRVKGEWYSMSIQKAKEVMIYLHNLNIEQDGSAEGE